MIRLLLLLALAADSDPSKRVDAVFAEYDGTASPGCAVGVFRGGRIDYARGYGMANLEHALAISPQTVFDIGSTSKQFTVMAVLLLEEDGKLRIDDDVRRYVPELPDYGPTITIRHLMQHTSGLRDYLGLFWLGGIVSQDFTTAGDALDVIVKQKALNFEPGSEYLYSNSGFFLLSEIVKRVSGKTLTDFAEERIFAPLGMRHSHVHGDHKQIVSGRATGYDAGPGGGFVIDMSDYEQTGDGAVFTTIEDLFLWDENFYHPKVGTVGILERMQTPGRLTSGKPISYGLGLSMRDYRGLPTVSHGGSWAGYRAQLLRFPEERLSVACICNLGTTDPTALARKVAEVYLGEKMTPDEGSESPEHEPIHLSSNELARLAGAYQEDGDESFVFLAASDGGLVLEAFGGRIALVPVAPDRFVSELELVVDFEGPDRFVIREWGDEPLIFSRIEPWTPGDLSRFAGVYESDEVGGRLEIAFADGALRARHRTIPAEAFRPTRPHAFHVAGLELSFSREGAGGVDGLSLDMGRVKGIRYQRKP